MRTEQKYENELNILIRTEVSVVLEDIVEAIEEQAQMETKNNRPSSSRSIEELNLTRKRLIQERALDAQIQLCIAEINICHDLQRRLHSAKIQVSQHYPLENYQFLVEEEDDDISTLIFRTKNNLQSLMFSLKSKLSMFQSTPPKNLQRVLNEIEKSMNTSTEAMLHCEQCVEGLEHIINSSALNIQRHLRGKWGRRRYYIIDGPRREAKFQRQTKASIIIQCLARKRSAKKRIEFKRLMLAVKAEVRKRNEAESQYKRLRKLRRELTQTFTGNELERMSKSVESIDNDALDEELAMLDDDLSSERVDKGGAWSLFYIN